MFNRTQLQGLHAYPFFSSFLLITSICIGVVNAQLTRTAKSKSILKTNQQWRIGKWLLVRTNSKQIADKDQSTAQNTSLITTIFWRSLTMGQAEVQTERVVIFVPFDIALNWKVPRPRLPLKVSIITYFLY